MQVFFIQGDFAARMSLWFVLPASLLFLALVTGVESQRSSNVYYSERYICALKGSTVTMTFTYLFNAFDEPNHFFWSDEEFRKSGNRYRPTDLSAKPEYSFRVQYFQEKNRELTMTLSNVTEEDEGNYYGVVTTMSGKWIHGRGGVILAVTDLQVEINSGRVFEGDNVILTCITTCRLADTSTFTWYKQGLGLIQSYSEQLRLSSVSQENAGSYSCGVMGQTYRSPYVTFDVYYPQKSISVSISPSGDIVEGSSVTLTCSSNANLPVQKYTWHKDNLFLSTGQSYSINQISSVDSGEYQCLVRGIFGQRYSDSAILNVLYPPKSISVSVSPLGEIVEGSLVTLTCNSDANPPVNRYTWYRGGLFLGTGRTYSINKINSEKSGAYKCESSNLYGVNSNAVTLNVLNPPKSVSVSISPSAQIIEGSLVTLTCSSDANPPVRSYTWYKVNESSPVGAGQSYSFTLSSSRSGWFYCVAQNKLGSQSAAAVAVTSNESSSIGHNTRVMVVSVAVSVAVGIAVFTAILLCLRRKKQRNANNRRNSVLRAEDSTYTSLEPMTRSPNDVYSTISTIHPRPNDTHTALDPHAISADYVNTLTTVRKYH